MQALRDTFVARLAVQCWLGRPQLEVFKHELPVVLALPQRRQLNSRLLGADLLERLGVGPMTDRKSTRLNSSHVAISYAVFCLKKKKSSTRCLWQMHRHTITSN